MTLLPANFLQGPNRAITSVMKEGKRILEHLVMKWLVHMKCATFAHSSLAVTRYMAPPEMEKEESSILHVPRRGQSEACRQH